MGSILLANVARRNFYFRTATLRTRVASLLDSPGVVSLLQLSKVTTFCSSLSSQLTALNRAQSMKVLLGNRSQKLNRAQSVKVPL
jgi:hypothetical protein